LWFGPADGPEPTRYALVVCPVCGAESVVEPIDVYASKGVPKQIIDRAADGTIAITFDEVVIAYSCEAKCLGCQQTLDVRITGRLFEPWPHGVGVVRRMPPFPEAPADGPEGGTS
jgi:hypothetical protein